MLPRVPDIILAALTACSVCAQVGECTEAGVRLEIKPLEATPMKVLLA
jgi:hypothetical protein